MTDARVHVFDADTNRFIGQIDAGFAPGLRGLAGSQDELRRDDVLRARRPRRAHRCGRDDRQHDARRHRRNRDPAEARTAVPTPYNTTLSDDGSRLYVSNITPSTSVTVIDTAAKKVLGEIDTDGCVLAYPSGNDRFSALCESGKALTVTLDAAGKETSRKLSDAFIDVDHDPAFINAVRDGKRTCSRRSTATCAPPISPATHRYSARRGRSSAQRRRRRAGVRAACSRPPCMRRAIVCTWRCTRARTARTRTRRTEIWVFDTETQEARRALGSREAEDRSAARDPGQHRRSSRSSTASRRPPISS